jgi:hypothetical protein
LRYATILSITAFFSDPPFADALLKESPVRAVPRSRIRGTVTIVILERRLIELPGNDVCDSGL